jgi:hypothetical protein
MKEVLILMKQTRLWLVLFALSVLVLTACAQEKPESAPGDDPDSRPDLSTPSPQPAGTVTTPNGVVRPVPTLPYTPARVQPTAPIVSGETPQALLDQMIDDLATHLGVEREGVSVVSAEATIWNDGSLGCPRPGEFYTQALVPGYRVILETNGKRYNYHASEKGHFFLCATALPGQNQLPDGSTPNQ